MIWKNSYIIWTINDHARFNFPNGKGLSRESNSRPLAPKARIIPLDHTAFDVGRDAISSTYIHITLIPNINLSIGNYGPLCATRQYQSVSRWCLQNILHYRINYFMGHITLQNVAKWAHICCIWYIYHEYMQHDAACHLSSKRASVLRMERNCEWQLWPRSLGTQI